MIYRFGYVPPDFTIITPIFIICVSLYSYVNTKLVNTSFSYIGFPSIWNVVLLYIEILNFNQWMNLFIILLFILLKFVPFKVLHPMRNVALKKTNIIFLFGTLLTSSILLMSKLEIKFINDFYIYFFSLWLIFNSYFILFVIFSNLLSSKLYQKFKKA